MYQISKRKPHNDPESDTIMKGLRSPYGQRGAICQHFGWTWDYLHHGIAWSVVERIMIDLPTYIKKDEEDIVLTADNAEDIMNYVNNMM